MFGIGMPELILILVVALIFFGPKRLPDLARSLGKGMAEFRKASDEVRQGLIEATREDERKDAPAKGEPGDPDMPSPYPPEAYGAPPATGPDAGDAPVSEPVDVASVESKEDPAEPKREPGKEARPDGA